MSYGLYITPTANRELRAVPETERQRIHDAIELLCEDPQGHIASRRLDVVHLKGYPGFCRLKVGRDWRVFFRYTNPIEVHAVRRRTDTTYTDPFRPGHSPEGLPVDSELALDEALVSEPAPLGERVELSEAQLAGWAVPARFIPLLAACETVDELLNLPPAVPQKVVEEVLDFLCPPSLERTQREPQYVVHSRQELEDYLSGRLSDLLLRLDPEQEAAANWRLEGPALVRGGPGTGKTVVALHRVVALAQHRPLSRVLFATYTTTLARYAEQLLGRLVEQRGLRVELEVRTLDSLVRERVPHRVAMDGEPMATTKELLAYLKDPLLFELGARYLQDEFTDVIEAWDLDEERYLRFDRSGRKRPLVEQERRAMWVAYDQWTRRLRQKGLITLNRARALAAQQAAPVYDAVIVDEVQDLPPVALRLLLRLAKSPQGLYLTADANQTLYSHGFSFRSVDAALNMRGRSLLLRRNYRSTRQIHALLEAIAAHPALEGEGMPEAGAREGDKPLLVSWKGSLDGEHLAELVREVCRTERLPYAAVGVLCPNKQLGEEAVRALTRAGLAAAWSKGEDLDLDQPAIKVLTLHSAKGLEFPVVFLLDVSRDVLPRKETVPLQERAAYEARYRKLFYVGCSRAMRRLVMTTNKASPSPFLSGLSEALWERLER